MSVNYAAGLSEYAHKGKCGQPEFRDSDKEFNEKTSQLIDWIKNCKHCVVLTGAGISTSTGIPDFRGPKGVWTLEEKDEQPNFATTFDDAKASFAHMALVALEKAGMVKYLITQNVDGLHLRSGFPRNRLSILHGDMFTEQCDRCGHQYIRDTCVNTMGLKHTGKACTNPSKRRQHCCRGKLKDTILDWEDSLPDDEIDKAIEASKAADIHLVLGSSLQIVPAGNLPLYSRKAGGKIVSVNLQKTKHHKKTDLVINSYIDRVMERVCERLGVVVPSYTGPNPVLYSTHDTNNETPRSTLNVSLTAETSPLKASPAMERDNKTLAPNANDCATKAEVPVEAKDTNANIDCDSRKRKISTSGNISPKREVTDS